MKSLRKNIMLGTAGHVDHGKTALVKMLTGCETDTLAEEKQRGLTIDLGFAPCRLAGDRVVGVVDVPGHVDFIRNMVAGAHGIDVVILVVAADDGIMPQTHEHLHILTLMGLRHGLVALTKIDLVEAGRRAEVVEHLRRLLAGTFLEQAPICPLSNVTGEGYDGFFDALNATVDRCDERSCAGLFRVWVEDVFTIRGSGTVITGIPTRGVVHPGDELHLHPGGQSGHVRRLQVYGEDAPEGRAGECVAMNVPDLDHELVRRGQVLSELAHATPVIMAEGELRILDSVGERIEDYAEVHLHVGTASVPVHVAMLESKAMTAGDSQMVQFRLTEPLSLIAGERFVVRANLAGSDRTGLTTIGGGRILGTSNTRLRRRKQWTIEALAARREALDDPGRWCEVVLREQAVPLNAAALAGQCQWRLDQLGSVLEPLRAEGRVVPTADGLLVHRDVVRQTSAKVLVALQQFHQVNPLRAGLGRDDLCASLQAEPALLDLAVRSLVETRQIEPHGTVFAQAGWQARVSDREQEVSRRIAELFQRAGWATPSLEEVAATIGEPLPRVETMARLLTERGVLVRVDERVCLHRDAIEAGQQVALGLFARASSFSTMQFRDALGVSRKYAVPLLDHLDKLRFTVRSGNHRTPGAEARKRLTNQ